MWATGYWATGYWATGYWPGTVASAVANGAWWHENYWDQRYWATGYWPAVAAPGGFAYKDVTESWVVGLTEGAFDNQGIEFPESLTVRWTESLAVLQQRSLSDTWTPIWTDLPSFSGGAVVPIAIADTLMPAWVEVNALTSIIAATDTLTLVVTDTGSTAVDADAIDATDDLIPVWTDDAFIASFDALVVVSVSDGWTVNWTESSLQAVTIAKGVKLRKHVEDYRLWKVEL